MNILILSNHFLPRIGGAELATHSLADALHRRGHGVTVAAPELRHQAGPRTGYRVLRRRLPPVIPTHLSKAFWLALEKRRHPFDLIHAQLLYEAGYEAVKIGRILRVPVVVSPQGADIHTYPPLNYGMLLRRELRPAIRFAAVQADALTYSSREMLRALRELGADPARCTYLPNGTVVSRFHHERREELRKEFGFRPDETIFVTVSRHTAIKGLDVLAEATERLRDIDKPFRVVIAGKDVEKLSETVSHRGIASRVTFMSDIPVETDADGIPVVPPTAIADLLTASDIYAAPALSGGFELSSADAFAAGLPVIIGDENGSKDLVEDHDAGIVVPAGDAEAFAGAMQTLLLDEERRQAMRRRSHGLAPTLDWDAIAAGCEKIYSNLIEQGG